MGRTVGTSSTSSPGHQRRGPELTTYLVRGGVGGFLAGTALAVFGEPAPMSSVLQQVLLLGVLFAVVGAFLAALAYLVADWRHDHPHLR